MNTEGILVAADQNQEWLLPWWWHHYSKHNSYPVAFADLGMTQPALNWCKERGHCFSLPPLQLPPFEKNKVAPQRRKKWERIYGSYIWSVRAAWFLKPFILAHSPFQTNIWMDLDCMVRGSLEPILQILRFGVSLAIAREPEAVQKKGRKEKLLLKGEVNYNTGVMGYTKNAEFLQKWIQKIYEAPNEFIGDQNVLTRILWEMKFPCFELSSYFNSSMCDQVDENALIHHYCGAFWKMFILKQTRPDLGENPTLPPAFVPLYPNHYLKNS